MLNTEYLKIDSIVLHKVGNKHNNDGIQLSGEILNVDETTNDNLLVYFTSPFKSGEFFNLYHESDLNLNEVFNYVSAVFNNPASLVEQSVNLAKHLYEQSNHPKIKPGEFYVVYFKDCVIEDKTTDAIGLFKSENKDTYLKVSSTGENYMVESDSGININKLDKGCIIFNTEPEKGYLLSVVDNLNKGNEAQYWIDDFLHVRQREDEYYQTQNMLNMCKSFVIDALPTEFEVDKADQADLLNKSTKYFKERENYDLESFSQEVIQQPMIIESFKSHRREFEKDQDVNISDSFDISQQAVKKQSRGFKSVIKLDKNFHIYVHGKRENIVRGFDEESGLSYYQLFFKEEK